MARMNGNERIRQVAPADLQVIHYPDPRLREICVEVEEVDDSVRALAERMCELMLDSRGVGLAAPQVGITVRLFVASPEFTPEDCHVYINPRILESEGSEDGEEGCLSFPGISCKVKRSRRVVIEATDLSGQTFRDDVKDLHARICQHESDHLDGRLLVDRMSPVAKLGNRRALKELEAAFAG